MHKKNIKYKKILLVSNINFFYFGQNLKSLYSKIGLKTDFSYIDINNLNIEIKNYDAAIVVLDPLILFEELGLQIKFNKNFDFKKYLKFIDLKNNQIINKLKDIANIIFTNYYNYDLEYLDDFILKANVNLKKRKKLKILNISSFYKNYGTKKIISVRNKLNFHNPFNKKYEEIFSKFVFDNINFFKISKKMIIFDCDNTLWKGIVGENKLGELEFNNDTNVGKMFYQIHLYIKHLLKKGIMICLCSKNNLKDVTKVFSHKKMILNLSDFTAIKINWDDKFKNIINLSKEINISLNSILFIDDNPFELSSVKKKLPEVTCFKVPENIYEYQDLMHNIEENFFQNNLTKEDLIRNDSYKLNEKRSNLLNNSTDLSSFLNSLKIKINVQINKIKNLDRVVQMCQRVNQFNFTTKRYTNTEVAKMLKSKIIDIFTFDIKDKFGEYGITGVMICIKNKKNKTITLDNFLMSCRVLGKNIHQNIFDYIIRYYKIRNYQILKIKYIKTEKNILVKNILIDLSKNVKKQMQFGEINFDINLKEHKLKNNNNYKILS